MFGVLIPITITYLLGRGYAEEEAIDDNNFRMLATLTHPCLGKVFE